MWNYAQLSKLAKLYGGPEKLVKILIDSGVKKGRWQMIPIIIGALLVGTTVVPIVNYFKAKRAKSQAELEAAKAELIQGIKDYDASHKQEGEGYNQP